MTDSTDVFGTEFNPQFPPEFEPFSANGQPTPDVTNPEGQYAEIHNVAEEKKRSVKARKYEAQANKVISSWFKASVSKPGFVADAAALSLYGPPLAEKVGDLAEHDPRVARFIDTLNGDVISNPYLATIAAALPLTLQLIRNHEPELEPKPRIFRIPFSKSKKRPEGRRLSLKKFGIRLGLFRHQTDSPEKLYEYVFAKNPVMQQAMADQGIKIASMPK